MLYYDRIDISGEINSARRNKSKECMIFHFWFFNHGFKFQDSVSNGCQDLTMSCCNIKDISIITIKNFDQCFIILNTSRSEADDLLETTAFKTREYIY